MTVYIDDIDLKTLGVRAKQSSSIMGIPGTRDDTMDLDGMHGAHDFGAWLEPKPFNLECKMSDQGSSLYLQYNVNDFVKMFLDDYGRPKMVKLAFSSEPNKYYMARYSGALPIQQVANSSEFNIPMTAFDPFKKSVVESHEIHWDSTTVTWDDDYSIDTRYVEGMQITSPQTVEATVNGYVIRPTIIITGSANNLTFQANGKSFSLKNFTDSTFEIRGDDYTILKNSVNGYGEKEGSDFLELLPGQNQIAISGSNINITLSIRVRDQYM